MDQTTPFIYPGEEGSKLIPSSRYENFIGGDWQKPKSGKYFENISPTSGKVICEVPRSNAEDIDFALDAAHKAAPAWGKTGPAERANILLKIADRIEENTEKLALAETLDNGKPIREGFAADIPLTVDHFRYFAGAIRAQEGTIGNIDGMQSGGGNSALGMMAYHYPEPLGVVGQIIPWNFPILMAAWKLAPALAAGNAVVLKPAEQTPFSINVLMEVIGDLLPAGVANIVHGYGVEAGKPLASSKRVKKVGFTGETTTGRLILQYASENLIPVTLELGGKSPCIVDTGVDLDKVAKRIVSGKFVNCGQTCIAPDYIVVNNHVKDELISMIKKNIISTYGNSSIKSDSYGRIINKNNLVRLKEILNKNNVEFGGKIEEEKLFIEPTLIIEPDLNSEIMNDEIFGPILPILSYENENEIQTIIEKNPSPLAFPVVLLVNCAMDLSESS